MPHPVDKGLDKGVGRMAEADFKDNGGVGRKVISSTLSHRKKYG